MLASFDVHTAEDVAAAVERARAAATWWAELGAAGRRARLTAWRVQLVRRTDELAAADLARERQAASTTPSSRSTIAIAHLAWAARNAGKVLRRRRVNPGLLAVNHSATLEYLPFGVVGVIGPWNYPVHTPMGSISYALAAGNAVVFKPSEYTPAVGQLAGGLVRRRRCPSSRCCSWSPASARPARPCARPASTSWPSPARRRPAGR